MSDSGTGAGSTPPGWYPDPQVQGQQRWWDGTAWTEHTAPLGGAHGQGGAGYASGVPAAAPVGATAGVNVDTWLWQSIVATVLCCLPLGIVGIVFSSQAQSAINAGNLAEAQQKAAQAKTFTLISVGLGILPVLFFLLFVVLGTGSAVMGF